MIALNVQPIEKQELRDNGSVEVVNDIWYTIQGEGPFVGTPAIFIRLAGCNLQCPACDTNYTEGRKFYSVTDVLTKIREIKNNCLVVLTGGEPFRQNLRPLVFALSESGYETQIETNGTVFQQDFPFSLCTIVCSPKTGTINKQLFPFIHSLKYIIEDGQVDVEDGLPLSSLWSGVKVARPSEKFLKNRIYVQPLDVGDEEQNKRHIRVAVESCMKFGYRMCLQTHKLLNLP